MVILMMPLLSPPCLFVQLLSLFFISILTSGAAAFSVELHTKKTEVIISRRDALTTVGFLLSFPLPTKATSIDESITHVTGTVTLQNGLSSENIEPGAALYITARTNKPDNVPKAILDGSRGKSPPVFASRFENPQFPFKFSLTSENLTVEGASAVEGSDNVWWRGEDFVVSARLDSDGVAATRDPTDLVGRGFYSSVLRDDVMIDLQGRGMFGKAVTSKKLK